MSSSNYIVHDYCLWIFLSRIEWRRSQIFMYNYKEFIFSKRMRGCESTLRFETVVNSFARSNIPEMLTKSHWGKNSQADFDSWPGYAAQITHRIQECGRVLRADIYRTAKRKLWQLGEIELRYERSVLDGYSRK